jgi:hypothetical protein
MRATLAERFWRNVEKSAGCWNWKGSLNSNGYGQISSFRGKSPYKAHRVSWFLEYGSWPTQCILHKCDNPKCVRPEHLFEGTRADNIADMVKKKRHRPPVHCLNHLPGEQHATSRLSNQDILDIRFSVGITQAELGRKFGVTQTQISSIRLGKQWKHLAGPLQVSRAPGPRA